MPLQRISNTDIQTATTFVFSNTLFGLGSAGAPSLAFSGDTNTGIFSPGADTIAFAEGGVESMRIDSSGNLGIGTTSATNKVDVYGSGSPTLQIEGTTRGRLFLKGNFTSGTFVSDIQTINNAGITVGYIRVNSTDGSATDSSSMAFATTASGTTTERMRITSAGNVGIGQVAPSNILHLYEASAPQIRVQDANGSFYIGRDSSSNALLNMNQSYAMIFNTAATERMRIDSSGNVGIGTSSPSSFNSSGLPLVVGSGSGNTGLTIYSGTAASGSIHFADGTTTTDSYRGIVAYSHTSNYMTFWTDATERMRIDSSGNVGIGTNAPAYKLDIYDSTNAITRIASDANAQLVIQRASTDTSAPIITFYKYRGTTASPTIPASGDITGRIAFYAYDGVGLEPTAEIRSFIDGTPGLDDMPGRLAFYTTPDGSGTILERMRITSTGRMLVGTTTENTSGGVLQVSNGITFPATQSASSDANTLDDYEEGTWTPTFGYSNGNGTMAISYGNNTGWYTKIGNLVYFRLDMRLSSFSKGTASGYPRIVGLPFNPVNSSGYGSMQVSLSLYNWTFSSQPIASVSPAGNPEISLFRMVSNGVPANLDDPDGDAFIWVSGCYVVS